MTSQRERMDERYEYEGKNTTTPSGTMVHMFSSARPSSSTMELSERFLNVNSNSFPLGPRLRVQPTRFSLGITCPQLRVVIDVEGR